MCTRTMQCGRRRAEYFYLFRDNHLGIVIWIFGNEFGGEIISENLRNISRFRICFHLNLIYVFFLYLFQMLQFILKEKSLFFIAIVFSLEYLMILYILYLISFGWSFVSIVFLSNWIVISLLTVYFGSEYKEAISDFGTCFQPSLNWKLDFQNNN